MTERPPRKRIFSLTPYLRSQCATIAHLPALGVALVKPRTSRALREKVMLAVTQVNDCRYCTWVHTGRALAHDVDLDELRAILDGQLVTGTDPAELVAIVFAQHFAETRGRPSPDATARLAAHYSAAQRREIMAYVHAIYFSNLAINTVDALLARLRPPQTESVAC